MSEREMMMRTIDRLTQLVIELERSKAELEKENKELRNALMQPVSVEKYYPDWGRYEITCNTTTNTCSYK